MIDLATVSTEDLAAELASRKKIGSGIGEGGIGEISSDTSIEAMSISDSSETISEARKKIGSGIGEGGIGE